VTYGRRLRSTLVLTCVVLLVPSALLAEYQSQPHPPDCATAAESRPACEDAGDARKHLAGFMILGLAGTGISTALFLTARRRKL
jgi:hypothetical protein